jgi:hypothetical protein
MQYIHLESIHFWAREYENILSFCVHYLSCVCIFKGRNPKKKGGLKLKVPEDIPPV